ncbi:MAG: hypothetical protein ACRECD_01235 [Burkholderiaceae bacterium]
MTEFTSQWLIPTITNLIAALLIWLIGQALSRARVSASIVKGVASSATRKMLPTVLSAAQYTFVFWFFITQLRSLIEQPGPPSRADTALIAFWTCWAVLMFVRVLAGRPLSIGNASD